MTERKTTKPVKQLKTNVPMTALLAEISKR